MSRGEGKISRGLFFLGLENFLTLRYERHTQDENTETLKRICTWGGGQCGFTRPGCALLVPSRRPRARKSVAKLSRCFFVFMPRPSRSSEMRWMCIRLSDGLWWYPIFIEWPGERSPMKRRCTCLAMAFAARWRIASRPQWDRGELRRILNVEEAWLRYDEEMNLALGVRVVDAAVAGGFQKDSFHSLHPARGQRMNPAHGASCLCEGVAQGARTTRSGTLPGQCRSDLRRHLHTRTTVHLQLQRLHQRLHSPRCSHISCETQRKVVGSAQPTRPPLRSNSRCAGLCCGICA